MQMSIREKFIVPKRYNTLSIALMVFGVLAIIGLYIEQASGLLRIGDNQNQSRRLLALSRAVKQLGSFNQTFSAPLDANQNGSLTGRCLEDSVNAAIALDGNSRRPCKKARASASDWT